MFLKLYNVGIKGKMWRMLKLLYKGFTCNVVMNGKQSDSIEVQRGIHQGAPCSMFCFVVFIDELLQELQQNPAKVTICSEVLNCVSFADDIALLAHCKADLQSLIDTAYRYSAKWKFNFNPKKCMYLIFGKEDLVNEQVYLGPHVLSQSDMEPHLGSVLATSPTHEQQFMSKRLSTCQGMCYAMLGLGSRLVPISPAISDKLYRASVQSKLCYAAEVMDIDSATLKEMETFHAKNCKMFQGLPNQTANTASLQTMGWHTVESHIEILRLLFFWRVLLMPMSNMYKLILIRRLLSYMQNHIDGYGPVSTFHKLCLKYKLVEIVFNSILSGMYMSIDKWKQLIKHRVLQGDTRKLTANSYFCKSLFLVSKNTYCSDRMLSWWTDANMNVWDINQCRIIIRLLLNTYRFGDKFCQVCNENRYNTVVHIIFECNRTQRTRSMLWDEVLECCPQRLRMDIILMNNTQKSELLLNCFNCDYVVEWTHLYTAVCRFVSIMYTEYVKSLEYAS